MGAIFFPTRAVGVSTSSFPKKMSSCLIFFSPNASRTLTQNGQWSYTYNFGSGLKTTLDACMLRDDIEALFEEGKQKTCIRNIDKSSNGFSFKCCMIDTVPRLSALSVKIETRIRDELFFDFL